ncbi:transcriptional activator hap3 [Polyrhizophydium stewartii]|uniref:Transcriptional activator hap3 n=1 Tax=Polyrhizophydium stewartii TaxID=2732419 RepID=A0ABR4NA01_9FUNG|nr:Nuclear transcription factor Y subunit B-8 [Polyrhizophydium stewartii]
MPEGGRRSREEEDREQDRLLPIANVARIMKRGLPENAKIAKEAKECIQECVSEFISFVTSEASDKCIQEKRKTINADDILWAMQSLGFETYHQTLQIYLSRYQALVKTDKPVKTDPHPPQPHSVELFSPDPSVFAALAQAQAQARIQQQAHHQQQ